MNSIVAHRGWSGRAPENTMAAFQLAFDNSSVEWIELDVQLSKDGVPVVIHDYTLKRTTSGSGDVKSLTYRELRELDAGSWFGPEFKGEPIPRLEQVLQAARGKCKIDIELKTTGDRYHGLELKVIELVHSNNMQKEVCLTSFDHAAVKKASRLDPSIRTGIIHSGKPLLIREQLREVGATVLAMDYKYLTKALVTDLINEGKMVIAWTVNDGKSIARISEMHPQLMICTNYPERVIELVK